MSPDEERNMLAFRNTLCNSDEGLYVFGQILDKLGYFQPGETAAHMALRNVATELLENCGVLFMSRANKKHAEASIKAFVGAISNINVMPLVDAQAEETKNLNGD